MIELQLKHTHTHIYNQLVRTLSRTHAPEEGAPEKLRKNYNLLDISAWTTKMDSRRFMCHT